MGSWCYDRFVILRLWMFFVFLLVHCPLSVCKVENAAVQQGLNWTEVISLVYLIKSLKIYNLRRLVVLWID